MSDTDKTPPSRAADFEYVDSGEALAALLDEVAGGGGKLRCAIDTEADSLHCYEEKLCLIQFAAGERLAIIDPLAIDDLEPLMDFLDGTELWLHGADFDMRMLRRTFGRIPRTVFDTQTAARLLGCRKFGLANLVEDHFGIVLPKGSQKADWGRRPLPDKMLDYAINDVRYLLSMANSLVERLHEAERWEWFTESCTAARASASVRREKDEDLIWRISGWGKLERRGMAFLRALWFWRDAEAARRDRPSFKIIGNDRLLEFANKLQAGESVRLPERFPPPPVRRFKEAVRTAAALPESQLPEGPKRVRGKRDPNAEKRFERLRARRDKSASEVEIDPTLIGSRATLERVAAEPQSASEILLRWQRRLLEPVLSELGG